MLLIRTDIVWPNQGFRSLFRNLITNTDRYSRSLFNKAAAFIMLSNQGKIPFDPDIIK